MRVLVSGATGLIGRHLLQRLSPEHHVVALTRDPNRASPLPHVEWCGVDLSQPLDEARLPGAVDAIIHLAQSAHHRDFPERAHDIFRINVDSTLDLLEYARRVGTEVFIFASSGGVCGYKATTVLETDEPSPTSFYLRTKHIGEQLLQSYGEYLSTVALRYFFVYGPGQWRNVIAATLERIYLGQPVLLAGSDGIRLNPTFAGEAAEITAEALHLAGSHTVNVAGHDVVSFRELALLAGRLLAREPRFELTDQAPGGMVADVSSMSRHFPNASKVSLEDGLRRTIGWYLDRDPGRFHDEPLAAAR
ncbi:MAG: NAD(P)-dependent oxidoreductase [Chloroflexi bacterium]|nr:NAD(P)-dependent oxidoreductase [Chloroflexota bacterium]